MTAFKYDYNEAAMTVVHSDHRVVWVNGAYGALGRFSRMGIDVHTATADGCLDCRPGPTTADDWEAFKASVLAHHGVTVTDDHKPAFLR